MRRARRLHCLISYSSSIYWERKVKFPQCLSNMPWKVRGREHRVSSHVIFYIFLTNTKITQETLYNSTGLHRKCKLDGFQTRLVSVTVLWIEADICHFLFSLITLIRSDLAVSHGCDCVINKYVLHNYFTSISQMEDRTEFRLVFPKEGPFQGHLWLFCKFLTLVNLWNVTENHKAHLQ